MDLLAAHLSWGIPPKVIVSIKLDVTHIFGCVICNVHFTRLLVQEVSNQSPSESLTVACSMEVLYSQHSTITSQIELRPPEPELL